MMAEQPIEAERHNAEGKPGKELTDELSLQSQQNNDEKNTQSEEGEHQYVTGFKLAIVMTSVTLVALLFMLDTSIISTVGRR